MSNSKRMTLTECHTDPKLLELIEKTRGYVMSKDEKAAQRKSWVIGNVMLSNPKMTREEAEAIYARVVE